MEPLAAPLPSRTPTPYLVSLNIHNASLDIHTPVHADRKSLPTKFAKGLEFPNSTPIRNKSCLKNAAAAPFLMTEENNAHPPENAAVTPDSAGNDPLLAQSATEAEAQLSEVQQKLTETHDAFLRAKAETENVRRRAQLDVSNAQKYAVESFSSALLSVKDSLEAALATANATTESMKSGVELTLRQLVQVFDKFKLSEVNPLGEKFDPHRHQAISMIEAAQPPNTVVTVLQKGYVLQDRVLRPALVTVSKGMPAEGNSGAAGETTGSVA